MNSDKNLANIKAKQEVGESTDKSSPVAQLVPMCGKLGLNSHSRHIGRFKVYFYSFIC